jgi:hypothetical protein
MTFSFHRPTFLRPSVLARFDLAVLDQFIALQQQRPQSQANVVSLLWAALSDNVFI